MGARSGSPARQFLVMYFRALFTDAKSAGFEGLAPACCLRHGDDVQTGIENERHVIELVMRAVKAVRNRAMPAARMANGARRSVDGEHIMYARTDAQAPMRCDSATHEGALGNAATSPAQNAGTAWDIV